MGLRLLAPMARRMTRSQLNSAIRRAQSDQRRAISQYNQKVRKHNTAVGQFKRDYNREVDKYNAAVRKERREIDAHNRRVRQNRQRLANELRRLERQSSTVQYVPVQRSVRVLNEAYEQVDLASDEWGATGLALADMAEAETANSAAAANALYGEATEAQVESTAITNELSIISPDLDQRWAGALFSLNDRNPDAARHFCTSAREILTQVIDLEAPDDAVLAAAPSCDTQKNGRPVRRAKISFLLSRSGADHESLRDFVDTDVGDVIQLFEVFNSATHGEAGLFDLNALRGLKQRVEGAIRFLSAIVRPTGAA